MVPTLSFIVLVYNYADLVGQTIRSILAQTVQDFEVIVVDDASTDGSGDVVRSFADPRIKLFVNERNMGGAASYNRAVEAASGEYLVNLDADDWIPPNKCEVQLAWLKKQPVAVLGSYVEFVDRKGNPAPNAAELEELVNQPHNLNSVESWIWQNNLARSSTIVERAAHMAVGLDDPTMVRAPDYELWMRFLNHGYRIAVVPENLVYLRVHSGSITHGDPHTAFLEMYYAMLRNLVPLIERRAALPSLARIVETMVADAGFGGTMPFTCLRPVERYRLVGMLATGLMPDGFSSFRRQVHDGSADDPVVITAGRRLLAQATQSTFAQENRRLIADLELYAEGREFWFNCSEGFEAENEELTRELAALAGAGCQATPANRKLLDEISTLRAEQAACLKERDYWYRTSLQLEAAARAAAEPNDGAPARQESVPAAP